jgi:lycopene cyclase domain-containing protein
MSTYLIVNLLALSMPLLLSFDKKVHFYTYWKYLFPGIIFTMFLFIPWDVFFTLNGVWGFNPKHLLGIYFLHIPIEEWMFFIVVPYASLFTYEVLKAYVSRDFLGRYSKKISILLIILLLTIALFNFNKAYTSISFILSATCIFITQFILKADYMGRFYLSYLVVLIPFFVVNGILTGSFIEEEVVWYNNLENLSFRIFTIPVEDSAYGFLLILMNTAIYESLKKRFKIINR